MLVGGARGCWVRKQFSSAPQLNGYLPNGAEWCTDFVVMVGTWFASHVRSVQSVSTCPLRSMTPRVTKRVRQLNQVCVACCE